MRAENVMLALWAIATNKRNAFISPRITTPGWRGGYHSGILNKWLGIHQSAMDTLVGHTNSGSNSMEKFKRRLKRLLIKQSDFTRGSIFFFYSALLLSQRYFNFFIHILSHLNFVLCNSALYFLNFTQSSSIFISINQLRITLQKRRAEKGQI